MSRRTRHGRLLVVAATIAIATGWPSPRSASAVAPCSEEFIANHFDGMISNFSPTYSARGSIFDLLIPLCSTGDGTSGGSTWVMVSGGGSGEYVQVGFARTAGMPAPMRFVEYNEGEQPHTRKWFPGWSYQTNHFYEVLFSFGNPPRKFTLKVDGVVLDTTPWSPEGGEWHVGWKGQFFGETWDRGDDISGTNSFRELFSNVKTITCWGCGWGEPPSLAHPTPLTPYKFNQVSSNYFEIWTQR